MKYVTAQDIFRRDGSRRGLPAWTYDNSELTRLEIEQVFLRNWLFVAHVVDLPRSGDYQCFSMGDERAVIVRGSDGEIRAFYNNCRHRASRVVPEEKGHCGKAFICPFHGWSYNLDGSLKNIPKSDTFPQLDRAQYGLKPLDCEVWHGLIFVRFGGDGPSVAQMLAEAEEEIGFYRIEDMQRLGDSYDFRFELDWKAVVDVDNEGYHVPIGHPELFDLMGSTYTDQRTEGGLSRSQGSFRDRKFRFERNREYVESLPDDSYLPESHRHLWIYWGMFPTFVLTLFPDQIEIYQFFPTGPQQSIMQGVCYALADDRPQMHRARELNQAINMGVGNEDIQLIAWVAEGMRSSTYDGLMLSDLELGVASFHNALRDVLPVLDLAQSPEPGTLEQVNANLLAQNKVAAAG
ncbi:MAG: aromatic ring-hydroxylating dioxygenase subunit alpha [Gammaproteobacteria bacterium]|nr:MAG: aromatic ring-hydroxylating dioxygenase subunit alpha [Gammaproteobacteria bacterium]